MNKQFALCIIINLFSALIAIGQQGVTATKIDENLTLAFPAAVTKLDTLGVSFFQSVKDKITYQVVRKIRAFDNARREEWKAAIEGATEVYMGGPRWKDFEKRSKDTIIGNTMGKYIAMKGVDHGQTMRLFIFVTCADRDMYSVQVTSFTDEMKTMHMLDWFYSHLRFKGIRY